MTTPVFTTLASFEGPNGLVALGGLTFDLAGNLYGTTAFGGTGYQARGASGLGTVFELSGKDHATYKVLVNFDGSNGNQPEAALTLDAFGNLYGTTASGGTAGMGTAFQLSGADHLHLTELASFSGGNGANPIGGLALYAPGQFHVPGNPYFAGHLFGTTTCGGANGNGTVFRLSGFNHKTLTTIVSFNAAVNGAWPGATLVADSAGHLFGTTFTGGAGTYGTVFELSGPDHQTLTTLASCNGTNGANPMGGLTLDAAGNLYGTTSAGGPGFGGTIFELAGPGHRTLTTLATFGSNDPNGAEPVGTLLIDAAGNLFGTTNGGADEFGDGALHGAVFTSVSRPHDADAAIRVHRQCRRRHSAGRSGGRRRGQHLRHDDQRRRRRRHRRRHGVRTVGRGVRDQPGSPGRPGEVSKAFFFEKKQKASSALSRSIEANAFAIRARHEQKLFRFFFSKNEVLSCFLDGLPSGVPRNLHEGKPCKREQPSSGPLIALLGAACLAVLATSARRRR